MTNEYKKWLQDQTFKTLATDNYNVKLLLLAEQTKNKKLVGLIETMCSDDWEDMTVFKFQKQMIKALNNAK